MSILSPHDSKLEELARRLAELADKLDQGNAWPARQLDLLSQYGVYRWFLGNEWTGCAWDEADQMRGYLALSAACLTTTFVLTQRTGACRRIEVSDNEAVKQQLLPGLASGELFATVGISHLTTSRRHVTRPVLTASRHGSEWVLDGFSPWVTGAQHADFVVVGAIVLEDEQPTEEQILAVVPMQTEGVDAETPAQLVGVEASHTGRVTFDQAAIDERWILAGPVENVLQKAASVATGGYQTSTLALGLANASLDYLADEASRREELVTPLVALQTERNQLQQDLFAATEGNPRCSSEQLRQRANSLALRASQSSLAAAKGAGYVKGHPAGRWCREALFFLVWSCPQPVLQANLCELAGIE